MITVKCCNCGVRIECGEDETVAVCRFCGTANYIGEEPEGEETPLTEEELAELADEAALATEKGEELSGVAASEDPDAGTGADTAGEDTEADETSEDDEASEDGTAEETEEAEAPADGEPEEKKTEKKAIPIVLLCCLVAVAAVIAALLITKSRDKKNTGFTGGTASGTGQMPAETSSTQDLSGTAGESDYCDITAAMVSFYAYSYYQSFAYNYSYYLSYIGLDTSVSLKKQSPDPQYAPIFLGEVPEGTWFDYFTGIAREMIADNVALCQAAKEAGMTLSEEDKAQVDNYVSTVKSYAEQYQMTFSEYVTNRTSRNGVTEEDVRRCLELEFLGSAYQEKMTGEYAFTDADREDIMKKDPASFYLFDFIAYTVCPDYPEGAGADVIAAAVSAVKGKADALAAGAVSAEEFCRLIDEADGEEGASADCTQSGVSLSSDSLIFAWAYNEGEPLSAGEVKVFEDKEGDTVTGYTVCLLTALPHPDDVPLKNVRHVLYLTESHEDAAGARAAAEAALAGLTADGTVTEEEIIALAKSESEDPGSKDAGGLYENVEQGYMVQEFNDWIYDPARKVGDYGIVETSYGAHIMYFVGNGDLPWKLTADELLHDNRLQEDMQALRSKCPVAFRDDVIALIP